MSLFSKVYQNITNYPNIKEQIIVGNKVSIGLQSILIEPNTIGENIDIEASSLVLKSVVPNSIVAGNPAHLIIKLF